MCSLVLLLFLIGGYNTVLAMREQRDEIARLTAELEGSKMTVSALKEQQAKKTENTAAEALKGEDAKNTDGGWKDGTYEGEGQGFGGKVVVEVTIENGEITCIEVKEAQKEDSAYLEMAKDIIEDIVDAQSADVDTISGATFSSTGIREAVIQLCASSAFIPFCSVGFSADLPVHSEVSEMHCMVFICGSVKKSGKNRTVFQRRSQSIYIC